MAGLNIIKHPMYEKYLPKYMEWRRLYEGDDIEGNSDYLPKHHMESQIQYDLRVQRSTYKNYIKPICNVWSSHIWKELPTRTQGTQPITVELDEKVETNSGNINTFFSSISVDSLVSGVQFVYIGFDPKSNKPTFINVYPENLVNWGHDEDGLTFITLFEQYYTDNGPFEAHILENRYKIIERDKITVVRETSEGVEIVEEVDNPIGIVPIVPFYFCKSFEMIGRSLIADVTGVIKKLFQKENELDIAEFYSCISFLFFQGFTEEEIEAFILSHGNAVRSSFTDAKIQYVEPTNKPLDALRQSIEDLYYALHEIVLRQLKNKNSMPLSYVRARLDNQQMETQLSEWSKKLADAEKQCWVIAGKYTNTDYSNLEIIYNNDFSIEEVESGLLKALSELVDQGKFEQADFDKLLARWDFKDN